MIKLFPLRPVEIIDVSFQLIRKKFGSSFFIALLVTIPFQFLAWVFEISVINQGPTDNLTGRTILLVFIIHFCSIGISLCTISNILSKRCVAIYCDDIFENLIIQIYDSVFSIVFFLEESSIKIRDFHMKCGMPIFWIFLV